jgi:hypothetical protein
MLKLGSIKWRGKCTKHPDYDPYLGDRETIEGGCDRCGLLAEIHQRHTELLALMKRFTPPAAAGRSAAKKKKEQDRQASLFGEFQ